MVEFAKEIKNTRGHIEAILGPMGIDRCNWLAAMRTVIAQLAVSSSIPDLADVLVEKEQIPKSNSGFSTLCLERNFRQEPDEWQIAIKLGNEREREALLRKSSAA